MRRTDLNREDEVGYAHVQKPHTPDRQVDGACRLRRDFHCARDQLLLGVRVRENKASLLLRRAAGYASPVIEEGGLKLDTAKKEVRLNDNLIELTAYEYKVLEYLMLNPSRVVSKTELTDHLYEQDFDRDSNVIEVFVGRLRKKLDPVNPIRTIRGQGYRFSMEASA